MDAEEWKRRQARAKDEVYDLINKGGIQNCLLAVDVAWRNYTPYVGPVTMPAGRKAEREWQGMSDFAKRMVVDAACALAYERSKVFTDLQKAFVG